jgi:replicative DNA helicase
VNIHRTLPSSPDAEKAVLASCFLSPNTVIAECIERITPEHFHTPSHETIYREVIALHDAGKLVDFTTITQKLTDSQKLEAAGGAVFISELFTFLSTASNADYYLDIVREKFLLRQLIQQCNHYAHRAYEEQGEVKALLDEAESKIMAIGEERTSSQIFTSKECALEAMGRYEDAYKSGGAINGLKTGLARLDELFRGMRGGQMIVVAAKQKRGKSSLAWQIVDYNAIKSEEPIPVGVASLEMGKGEITDRRAAMLERIDLTKLDSGSYTKADEVKISRAITRISKSQVFIRDDAALDMMQIRSTFRRMKREYGIKLGMIDYLQIVSPENRKDGRERQIAMISVQIKQLAKELDIPIMVLIQLNKDGDARESKAIEMDCDKLVVIEAEDEEDFEENPEPEMNLRVKYNRAGPCGRARVRFIKKYTLFEGM